MREEYLVHHGVKGMHWGIRRYRNKDGTLTDAGIMRYSKHIAKRDSSRNNYSRIYIKEWNKAKRYAKKMYKTDDKYRNAVNNLHRKDDGYSDKGGLVDNETLKYLDKQFNEHRRLANKYMNSKTTKLNKKSKEYMSVKDDVKKALSTVRPRVKKKDRHLYI